jgi:hypothetical protein
MRDSGPTASHAKRRNFQALWRSLSLKNKLSHFAMCRKLLINATWSASAASACKREEKAYFSVLHSAKSRLVAWADFATL